jgi:hypothetical protein
MQNRRHLYASESRLSGWNSSNKLYPTTDLGSVGIHEYELDLLNKSVPKKRRFAFQTFTQAPATTPSTLGFGITHQPHGSRDGAKCGALFAQNPFVSHTV